MTESPTAVTCPATNPAAGGGKVLVVVVVGAAESAGGFVARSGRCDEPTTACGWDPEPPVRITTLPATTAITPTPVMTTSHIRRPRSLCRAMPGIVAAASTTGG